MKIFLILFPYLLFAQARIIPFSTNPTTAVGGATATTRGLTYYWDASDLGDGEITNWADREASYTLTQASADSRPSASSGILINDGNDYLNVAYATTVDSLSFEFIGKYTDTTTASIMMGLRYSAEWLVVGINNGQIYAYGYDGTVRNTSTWGTPYLNTTISIIATWDGPSDPKLYINGTLMADQGGTGLLPSEGVMLVFGGSGEYFMPNASEVQRVRVYNSVLNQDEIDDNVSAAADILP